MKKVTQLAAAIALTAGAITAAPVAMAETSASVAIASTYLWRGYDLGSGTPAVSGDISYSTSGFYVGAWASSGDTSAGTEYDLYAGWGMEMDAFSIDVMLINYLYPTGNGYTADGETDFGDFSEVILTVGLGPVSVSYYDNIASGTGYEYYTIGTGFGQFSATLGMHDNPGTSEDPMHLDLSYSYNDNLAFTVSQFISDEPGGDDLKFVVSYSIPLDM